MVESNDISRRAILLGGVGLAALLAGCRTGQGSAVRGTTTTRPLRTAVAAAPAVAEPLSLGKLRAGRHRNLQDAPAGRGKHPERAARHAAAQRSQPDRTRPREVPLVLRRRDAARHRAARRRSSLPQPLGSHRYRRRSPRAKTPIAGQPPRPIPRRIAAQTSIVSHAGKTLALYEASLPD